MSCKEIKRRFLEEILPLESWNPKYLSCHVISVMGMGPTLIFLLLFVVFFRLSTSFFVVEAIIIRWQTQNLNDIFLLISGPLKNATANWFHEKYWSILDPAITSWCWFSEADDVPESAKNIFYLFLIQKQKLQTPFNLDFSTWKCIIYGYTSTLLRFQM